MIKKSEYNFPGIYRIRNKITETVYIGQAEIVTTRWATHRRCLRRNKNTRNLYLQRAWNKYREDNFIFEIVFQLIPMARKELQIVLDNAEILILKEYKDNCYNLMEAGISSMVASESTLEKLSEHNKKQWQKPEHRAKISRSQKDAWNEPGRKAERTAQLKESFKDPDYKKRRSELSKQAWEPGGCLRETQSAKRKANWQNPEYIAKQKASRKKTWENIEIREKRARGIRESWARRKLTKFNEDPKP